MCVFMLSVISCIYFLVTCIQSYRSLGALSCIISNGRNLMPLNFLRIVTAYQKCMKHVNSTYMYLLIADFLWVRTINSKLIFIEMQEKICIHVVMYRTFLKFDLKFASFLCQLFQIVILLMSPDLVVWFLSFCWNWKFGWQFLSTNH